MCLLNLDYLATIDPNLSRLEAQCVKKMSRYKRGTILRHYLDTLNAIQVWRQKRC